MRFLPTLLGSFHSPATYENTRYHAQGWGLFYAFVLVMLTTAVSAIYLTYMMHTALLGQRDGKPPLLDNLFEQTARQLPPMQISPEGTLTVEAEQPYYIVIEDEVAGEQFSTSMITIDTTGQVTHSNMDTPILITATDLITQKSNGEIELHPLSKFTEGATQPITTAQMQDVLGKAGDFLRQHAWKFYALVLPFLWGIVAGIFYVMRIVMLMAVGVVATIVGNVGPQKMEYSTAVRMASVAYTPVEVFNTVAFLTVMDGASVLTLFALGSLLVAGAIVLTNHKAAA